MKHPATDVHMKEKERVPVEINSGLFRDQMGSPALHPLPKQ